VTAVEFMPNFSAQNEVANAHRTNTSFICEDVCKLDPLVDTGSYDVIFINWLLMYLGDKEVTAFASHALRWLAPGGSLFFRESCVQQSGNAKRAFNPTHYRDPAEYTTIFAGAAEQAPPAHQGGGERAGAEEKLHRFQLERMQPSEVYRVQKGNANQMTFLWKKANAAVS
jgi:phosphoethanolamine N-methyltransferase